MKKIFNPRDVFYFNVLVCLLILYFLVEIPLVLFFRPEDKSIGRSGYSLYFIYASVAVFMTEIFVRLRSSKVLGTILIEDQSEINNYYLGAPISIDLLGIFILMTRINSNYNLQFLQLTFFLKVYNLYLYDQSFNWVLGVQSTRLAVYNLIKAGIYLFYFSHISACIFFIIDYTYYAQQGFYYQNSYLWLLFEQCMSFLIDWPLPVQYQYGLYWAIMTSTSVAYGDIYPKNLQEVLFTSFMFFPIFVLFSLLMNTTFQTFSIRDQAKLQRYLTRDTIKNMLKKRNIILKHIYLHQLLYQANMVQQLGDGDSKQILDVLSKQLYKQLSLQIYSEPYAPFMKLSSNFVKLLYKLTQEKYYFTGQPVTLRRNYAYVFAGQLKQFVLGLDEADFENGSAEMSNVKQKEYLNVFGIITGRQQIFFNYFTTQTTQLYILKRDDLENNLFDKEKCQLQKAQFDLLVNKNYLTWKLQCKVCHSNDHLYTECHIFTIQRKGCKKNQSKNEMQQERDKDFSRSNFKTHKQRGRNYFKSRHTFVFQRSAFKKSD